MGNKGDQTTIQSTAPNPAAMKAYQDLMSRASGVANTPYNPYGGQLTAGVNAQQNLGIGNINSASQAGQPYFDYASSMAHPLSQSDIERYQNPYTQNVVDATQAQFNRQNAQQQEGLKGRAIAQGSLGGSRANIAAADMGYNQQLGQAPVIAGLYNQSYNQALGAAQQQQQAGFQGAGVGANIQQAGLQGAGAQIGAGTLQQQTEQQQLNALYQQYQQAQAFPYQQTQWLAGIDTGVGSQMGGTSTTTAPAPSLLGQLAGVGTAAAGAYLGAKAAWRGGGVGNYDAGGSVGSDPYGGVGFVPRMQIHGGAGAPHPPGAAQIPQQKFDPSKFAFPKSGVGNYQGDFSEGLPGGSGFGGEAAPFGGAAPEAAEAAGSFLPEGLAGVGSSIMSALPEGLSAALPFLLLNRGGGVRGYADGGSPLGFDDRWNGAPDDMTEPPPIAGVGGNEETPIDRSRLPRQFFDADAGPSNEMAYAPKPSGVAPPQMPPAYDDGAYEASRAPVAGVAPKAGFDWSSLSMPLMAAGLGMMASRSPHPGVAIGEGGLAGVQAYAAQKRETAEQGLAEKKQALDARRLDQMAQQSREHLALQTRSADLQERTAKFHESQADRPYREQTAQQKAELEARRTPPGWVRDPDGKMVPDPGGMHDPETIRREALAKTGHGLIDDDTLSDMAGQYLAGDKSVFQNIGRGAQGSENIVRLRQRVAEIARDQGLKPDQIATKMADFAGRTAAMRALGTRGANVEYAANTASGAIDLAEESAKKMDRSMFVPWNQLVQAVQNKTSSPAQADFYAKTNTLVNEYARVAAGGNGAATEGMRQHAREMLNTSMGKEGYLAVLNAMRQEIATAKKAYNDTRKEFLSDHSEGAAGAPKPTTAAPAPVSGAPQKGERKQFKQGWGVWDGSKWVPEKG